MSEKDEYSKKLQKQFEEWKKDLDDLKKRSETASAEAKAEMESRINSLKEKMDEISKILSQISAASDEAWASIRDGVDSAWTSWKKAFNEALGKLK